MKPIMAVATATEPMVATATATAAITISQEPITGSRRARKGMMVRTIKMDFDQSVEMSKLISRHTDQQRWAFNMAVEKTLKDPAITGFDLYNKLTKWRKWEQVA